MVVNEIKLTVATETGERFFFSELQSVERASISRDPDSNDDAVLIALSIDGNNSCGDSSHYGTKKAIIAYAVNKSELIRKNAMQF